MKRVNIKLIAALALAALLGSPAVAQPPSNSYCHCMIWCNALHAPDSPQWGACEADCALRFEPQICLEATTGVPGGRMCGNTEGKVEKAAKAQAPSGASRITSPAS